MHYLLRCFFLGALIGSAGLHGAQSAPPADIPWEPLFNGKDLAGWVEIGHEKWTVEDGTIHGQGSSAEYGYLRTAKKYQDFQMTLRFRCEADGNSGVYFRCDFKPGTATITQGLQFEIDRVVGH